MSRVYGYCRISTAKQSIERQERNIQAAYPNAIIIKEVFSGTKTDGRQQLERLLKTVNAGDMIVFDSVSRMSRNAVDGFELYQKLYHDNIELVFLKERHIDTVTYKQAMERQIGVYVESGDGDTDELIRGITEAINCYVLKLAKKQIFIAFEQAEKEVNDLHQRTREGIETARLKGKQIGGQRGRRLNVKKAVKAKEIIRMHSKDFSGTLKDNEVMRLTGIARNTYYKYKRELKAEMVGML